MPSRPVHHVDLRTVCAAIDRAISQFLESSTIDDELGLHWAQLVALLLDSRTLAPAREPGEPRITARSILGDLEARVRMQEILANALVLAREPQSSDTVTECLWRALSQSSASGAR
jgi:hypothetical protein